MVNLMGYSVLVDNEEQAKKLQEIAFEQGFEWRATGKIIQHLGVKAFQFGIEGEKVITWNFGGKHYQDEYITKKTHFNELFDTLEQQLEKAKAEIARLEKEIENNKIKVGDWVYRKDNCIWKIRDVHDLNINLLKDCVKITNPQLIQLLENERNY